MAIFLNQHEAALIVTSAPVFKHSCAYPANIHHVSVVREPGARDEDMWGYKHICHGLPWAPSPLKKIMLTSQCFCIWRWGLCKHAKPLQSCPVLCDPMENSPPGSSVHGILQAKTLEWVAMPSDRGSSPPRDQTCVCYVLAGRVFTTSTTGKLEGFTEVLRLKRDQWGWILACLMSLHKKGHQDTETDRQRKWHRGRLGRASYCYPRCKAQTMNTSFL